MNKTVEGTKGAHPAAWVPTLYIAEGLPFVATMTVSVLMYKSLGLSDTKIAAFTSIVALPWSLKPLWSGFMESFKTKKHFVLGTQFLGGVAFALLAMSLSSDAFVAWSLACFALIAFNSATHDIAADGLYIESLSNDEQARFVGLQGAFWNVGKILAQGGLVWLAGRLELVRGPKQAWTIIMFLFAGLLILFSVYHKVVLPSGRTAPSGRSTKEILEEFWYVVATFFQKRYVYWGLAFVILYRFAEGQAQKILPLFLRADRTVGGLGLSTETVGLAYGTCGAMAFVLGSIGGGLFSAELKLRRALLPLCAIFNLPYVAYVFLAWMQPSSVARVAGAVLVEYLGYGFGFVAVTLFMMQQMATGRFKMSHYAIGTSAMQLGLILPGVWSGWLSDHLGYRNFFTWVMFSTLFSFAVAAIVPFKNEREIAAEDDVASVPGFRQLFFTTGGRIEQASYWFGQVVLLFLVLLTLSVDFAAKGKMWILSTMALALTAFPMFALDIKRFHDRNRPGWFAAWRFVVYVLLFQWQGGSIGGGDKAKLAIGALSAVVIVYAIVELVLLRGTLGTNRFGHDPVVEAKAAERPVVAPSGPVDETTVAGPSLKSLFFTFEGRLGRAQYWFGQVMVWELLALALGLDLLIFGRPGAIVALMLLLTLVSNAAIQIKRCHDRNRSGWFAVLLLVPLVQIWYVVEIWFLRGTLGENRFGGNPLHSKAT